jgi:16S rRNA (cytosine967-C5)-methyltransferase
VSFFDFFSVIPVISGATTRRSRDVAFGERTAYIRSVAQHISNEKAPGLPARLLASQVLYDVLQRRRPLDQTLDPGTGLANLRELDDRDRALVHMLAAKTLRRLGTLRALLGEFLERGPPKDAPRVEILLLLGAAQILFLDVKDHAAVDLSVELANRDRGTRRYAGLINAVLRRVVREGRERIAGLDRGIDTPSWLLRRWCDAYGREAALAIADAHKIEPPLDLTMKENAADWAGKLGGYLLPTDSVRLANAGPVAALAGYEEGAWWVQDAAASLPAKLLGDIEGKSIADLCAAPGGKTAQLIAGGAKVVAVDRSVSRLKRLKENLARLQFDCETVEADAAAWSGGPFDAVLLDAPCTATGTIRRNPDLPWQREPADLARLSALQARILDNAVRLVKPEGILVYATCSLEPEEGERQIEALLGRYRNLRRVPIDASETGGVDNFVSVQGDLRTLPCHLPNQESRLSGCDGFYAARLQRLS